MQINQFSLQWSFSSKSHIEKKSIKSVTFFDLDKNIRKELNINDNRELFEYDKPLMKCKSLPSNVENNEFEDFVDEWCHLNKKEGIILKNYKTKY